jgi:hypothetical protein
MGVGFAAIGSMVASNWVSACVVVHFSVTRRVRFIVTSCTKRSILKISAPQATYASPAVMSRPLWPDSQRSFEVPPVTTRRL